MSELYTAVGSNVNNLAGSVSQRPNYLKSLIIGGIRLQAPSLGQVLNRGYANGPTQRIRSFLRWAKHDPDFLAQFGVTSATLLNKSSINYEVVRAQLADQVSADQGVQIDSARVDAADMNYWVLRYLASTRDGVIPVYTFEYDPNTGIVTVSFEEAGDPETFTPNDFFSISKYMYVGYRPIDRNKLLGQPDVQAPVTVPEGQNFPALDGYTQDSLTQPHSGYNLSVYEEIDLTYSDNRTPVHTGPTEISHREDVDVVESHGIYHKDESQGPLPDNPNSATSLRTTVTQDLTYEIDTTETVTVTTRTIENGVVETKTTTRTQDRLVPVRVYQISTQTLVHWAWLTQRFYLYPQGGGKPELDMMFISQVMGTTDGYYPPIPFRYNNAAIVEHGSPWHIEVNVQCTWGDSDFELWIARDKDSTGGAIRAKFVKDGDYAHSQGTPWAYYVTAFEAEETLASVLKGGDNPLYAPVFQWRTMGGAWKSPWSLFSAKPRPTSPTFNNENTADLSALHEACKKAFKKAIGAKYDEVQRQILASSSLADIDHAFAVFGVSLNTKDKHARKYIYKFFEKLLDPPGAEQEWLGEVERVKEEQTAANGQETIPTLPDPPSKTLDVVSDHPGVIKYKMALEWSFIREELGTGQLQRPAETTQATDWEFQFTNMWDGYNDWVDGHSKGQIWMAPSFDRKAEAITVGWTQDEDPVNGVYTHRFSTSEDSWTILAGWMKEAENAESYSPLIFCRGNEEDSEWFPLPMLPSAIATSYGWKNDPDVPAKTGDLWWKWDVPADDNFELGDRVELYWQTSATTWKKLVFTQLIYKNYVYEDHVISRRANVQLNEGRRRESDFIIPLQDDVLKSLSAVDQAQVCTACAFLVFNSYEIKQKEFYQEDWFKWLITAVTVIITVAITVITYGVAGPGAVAGAMSIGAALGLTGWAAVIVGGIIIAIMTTAIGQLLSMLMEAVTKDMGADGQLLGALISTVVSIAMTAGGSAAWTSLSTAQTVMSLASLATAAATTLMSEEAKKIAADTAAMLKKANEKSGALAELHEELMGQKSIDLELARKFVNELTEKPDVFLQRTLMTGSDIVESTLKMISNYAEYNLRLDLP